MFDPHLRCPDLIEIKTLCDGKIERVHLPLDADPAEIVHAMNYFGGRIGLVLEEQGVSRDTFWPMFQDRGEPIFHLNVPGIHALETRHKLVAPLAAEGYCCVLIGGDRDYQHMTQDCVVIQRGIQTFEDQLLNAQFPAPKRISATRPIIEKSADLDTNEIFRRMRAENGEFWEEAQHGAWPEDPRTERLSTLQTLERVGRGVGYVPQYHARVHMAILPTRHSAEAPAYLDFGNFNQCPPAEEHIAVVQHLEGRYGAELVGINQDTLELLVASPPRDNDEALVLAEDLACYCTSIIASGRHVRENIAATLMKSRVWHFWWE